MKVRTAFCAALLVWPFGSIWAAQFALSAKQILAVKESVGQLLKDPYSAKFKNPVAVFIDDKKKPPIITICGLVNAKNGFGAYVGDRPYVGALYSIGPNFWQFEVVSMADDDNESASIIKYCNNPRKNTEKSSANKAEEIFSESDLPGLQPGDLEKIFGR